MPERLPKMIESDGAMSAQNTEARLKLMTSETEQREPDGKFSAGNKIWKTRTDQGGRPPKFESPEALAAKCEAYFDWVHANPLYEAKAFSNGLTVDLPKMRAMTIGGMCLHLGIALQTWRDYAAREDFSHATEWAEQVIRTYKFEGAAADLLSPNIIARDLGLVDKSENKVDVPEGGGLAAILARIGATK